VHKGRMRRVMNSYKDILCGWLERGDGRRRRGKGKAYMRWYRRSEGTELSSFWTGARDAKR